MFNTLPPTTSALIEWGWAQFEPYYLDLQNRPVDASSVQAWLKDWSLLGSCLDELYNRLLVRLNQNTTDQAAEQRYNAFFDQIYPKAMQAEDTLKQKLLASGFEPEGFEIALRNMRSETDLFRAENLALKAEESKLNTQYEKIIGAQTVTWEGEERTVAQLSPVYQETNRARREQAWRLVAERQLTDREAINQVWGQLLPLRVQLAKNAGRPDYRAYRWQELLRFDYTPDDARRFQQAIEEVAVPAAARVLQRRRERLGLSALRPWDLVVDPEGRSPLRPFADIDTLTARSARIFHQVDPHLGSYFDTMIQEELLDLDNRKNKAPGGYCTSFLIARRPFIFMNAVGVHDNVQTLLHEGGHAFHVFESATIPYIQSLQTPMEFAEVASMSMELLASPYLTEDQGGFYTPAQAARARIEHLEESIRFWPYMAVVDAFQDWVYENPQSAADPSACDDCWSDLWQRFMPGVDWSGLEDVMATGWHRKLHIHTVPFYYIEYGLALLGAVQVWHNALHDQAGAVARYRHALALGGTVTLPELFKAAGARFAFDADTLTQAVSLLEEQVQLLEKQTQ